MGMMATAYGMGGPDARQRRVAGMLDDQHDAQTLAADQGTFDRAEASRNVGPDPNIAGRANQDQWNNQRMNQFGSFMGRFFPQGGGATTASSTAFGNGTGAGMGTWHPTPIAPVTPVDTSAASAASFARAKDQVGQETSGALTGLRSAMAGRGMLGSGSERRGTVAVVNRGQGELGDVSRQQAITEANLAQRNAETNYQGALTERGQDTTAALTERGQDLSAWDAQAERTQRSEQSRWGTILGLWRAMQSGGAY